MMGANRKACVNGQIALRVRGWESVYLDRTYKVIESGETKDIRLVDTEARGAEHYPRDEKSVPDYCASPDLALDLLDEVLERDPAVRFELTNYGEGDDQRWVATGGGVRVVEDEVEEALAVFSLETARRIDREEEDDAE